MNFPHRKYSKTSGGHWIFTDAYFFTIGLPGLHWRCWIVHRARGCICRCFFKYFAAISKKFGAVSGRNNMSSFLKELSGSMVIKSQKVMTWLGIESIHYTYTVYLCIPTIVFRWFFVNDIFFVFGICPNILIFSMVMRYHLGFFSNPQDAVVIPPHRDDRLHPRKAIDPFIGATAPKNPGVTDTFHESSWLSTRNLLGASLFRNLHSRDTVHMWFLLRIV